MRQLVLSVFVGLAAAFLAWTASLAVAEVAAFQASDLTEHHVLAGGAALLGVGGLIALRQIVDPGVTGVSVAAGCIALWDVRAFPEPRGYSPEYWTAIGVTSMVFIFLLIVLHSELLFRDRR